MIYSDDIGAMVAEMGYKGMLTEGAKHILGWKSPNFLYANPINPRLKLLLRNYKLSDDIAFRFSNRSWSEYPLTTEKYAKWLNFIEKNEETVNIFMDYETFGEHQSRETGIFEFLKALPNAVFKNTRFSFSTPSEIFEALQPVAVMNVPYPISWADEERDLTAWLGNPLQEQAFNKLYDLLDRVRQVNDEVLQRDYNYLQVSDHFYYMCTKFFSDGEVHSYFNPYGTPYEAFINYMNVLSDFEIRLNAALKSDASDEVRRLSKIISQKDEQLKNLETRLSQLTLVKSPVSRKADPFRQGTPDSSRKIASSGKKTAARAAPMKPAGKKPKSKKTTGPTGKVI
jgi:alpha-amylase